MCLSVRGSYSLFARPANIQSVSAIQGDLLGSSRVIIKLDNCNTESSKMPASFSYVVYLHPVASNWRLPKDPIAAADGAVSAAYRQTSPSSSEEKSPRRRRGTAGGHIARHKIFALRFEDTSLGYKGSGISIAAIRDRKLLVSYKIKS